MTDGRWIASLCLARAGFALIFVAYSASLGLLKQDWGLSSAQAGLIQSAWHVGYLVSLFAIGFLADRYGAKRTFLATSIAACASGLAFAAFAVWAYVFHSWELLGMWAWLPTYLGVVLAYGREGGTGVAGLGIAFAALTYLISMAGSIGGGVLSDRWGRTAVILLMSMASLICSFTFGWLIAAPAWIVVAVAIAYNLTAIGDSSIYSTALTELVPGHCLGAAWALRSVLGFGFGAISPWVFGLVLDLGQGAGGVRADAAWGWAWTALGLGAMLGPIATLRLRALRASTPMAGGKR